ncbi:MAG: M12 family metallo-peptidase [Bacteroidota bacterium]|nr:M12 family metallo-peptidase [Bacteroidota bacterium]
MRKILLSLSLLLCSYALLAQNNFWRQVDESSVGRNLFAGRHKPSSFKLFQLNETAFENAARLAPSERTVSVQQSDFIITIPNPNGELERYKVVDAPVMDPALAAKYPGIRSYAGVSVADPGTTIRFSVSPLGFHGMILSDKRPTIYIDPLGDDYYMVVSRADVQDYRQPFGCETLTSISEDANTTVALRNADDGRLRTYRLALVASGEFSQYWLNGTETTDAQRKGKVLAAMNNQITRVNGIYERDFGVRLILIANNDAVIYLNAATDPIGTSSGSWNSQTQTTCTNVIGSANYDVGHLVHRGPTNNGNAGCIGCVCTSGSKGSGWTSYIDLSSDYFVVDYLTHELGHQFGGNHTFTHANEGTIAQCEPGSGSTIMSYAGITGATTDVQAHNDDYFHARTIEQVTNYIKSASGSCAVTTLTGNAAPTATAGSNYIIPRSTPFTLTGTGADADAGDVLTYCWEQINQRATGSSVVPSATATAGPQFRSYLPNSSTSRTFPVLTSILSGTNSNKWEVLPSVARTLNFRFTVRDNHPGAGNNESADMVVTINGTAGPFAVTSPNTGVTWAGNTTQTITWSVNSTNIAPVSCANVKISISTDGGNNFTTLLASTPNDGTQAVTIPNTPTSTARIKIEAVGNIFFDISNTNFTISGAVACGNPAGLASSAITTSSATVSWTAVSGAVSYDVDYKITASGTWTNAATATTATSINLSGLSQSTVYDWRVRTNCSSLSSAYSAAQFTTLTPATCNAPAGLSSTAITTSSATVSWTAVSGAVSYDVEYKTTASGTWTNAATGTTATSINLSGLSQSTVYDWRVRTNCSSLSSAYSAVQFTTLTPAPCDAPIGLASSSITTSSATVSWAAVSGAVSYDVDYKTTASGTWTNAATATTGTSVNLSGLSQSTVYDWRVRTNCSSLSSAYSSSQFTTVTASVCPGIYDVSTNGTASGAALIPFNTDIKGLISPLGDNDYYRFVITTGGTATITLTTLPFDFDIRLYNSNGTTQLAIAQNGGTNSETITRTYTAGTYYVRVYGYNGANSPTSCYTLKVALGTATRGDDLITMKKVSVFPNPVSDNVTIRIDELKAKAEISIIDIFGKTVIHQNTTLINTQINLSKLSAGLYLVKVINEGKESTMKIVKE